MTDIITAKFSQILPRWQFSASYELTHTQGKFTVDLEVNPVSKTCSGFHNFFKLFFDYKFSHPKMLESEGENSEKTPIQDFQTKKCVTFDIPLKITKQIQVTKSEFSDIRYEEIKMGDIYLMENLNSINTDKEKIGATLAIFHKDQAPQPIQAGDVDDLFSEEAPASTDTINGIKIGTIVNAWGIEYLEQIGIDSEEKTSL